MTEITERVARLEGAYDHLATKADIQALNADLTAKMAAMEKEIGKLKGGATAVAVGVGAVLALLQIVFKFAVP